MTVDEKFEKLLELVLTATAWIAKWRSELLKVNGGGHRDIKKTSGDVTPGREYLFNESSEWFNHAV